MLNRVPLNTAYFKALCQNAIVSVTQVGMITGTHSILQSRERGNIHLSNDPTF